MKKLVTTLVNNKLHTRKIITIVKNGDDSYDVTAETIKRGQSHVEVLETNVLLYAAHFRYTGRLMALGQDGYLIEIGGSNAYE